MAVLKSLTENDSKVGSKIFDKIDIAGEKDTWSVFLEDGQAYSFHVGADPGVLDPVLELTKPNGDVAGGNDDINPGFDLDAHFNYSVPVGEQGTYVVEVSGFGNTVGKYSLLIDIL